MSYEELYRKELELKAYHNPISCIRQIRNECRERKMTYRLGKENKTWITRFLGKISGTKNSL